MSEPIGVLLQRVLESQIAMQADLQDIRHHLSRMERLPIMAPPKPTKPRRSSRGVCQSIEDAAP